MTVFKTKSTTKPKRPPQNLASWGRNQRGYVSTLPDPDSEALPGSIRKLIKECRGFGEQARVARKHAQELRDSRRSVEQQYREEAAIALREGEPIPADPLVKHDADLEQAERESATFVLAEGLAFRELGCQVMFVKNDALLILEGTNASVREKLANALIPVTKLAERLAEIEAAERWLRLSDSVKPAGIPNVDHPVIVALKNAVESVKS